jgi:hypothetical protein
VQKRRAKSLGSPDCGAIFACGGARRAFAPRSRLPFLSPQLLPANRPISPICRLPRLCVMPNGVRSGRSGSPAPLIRLPPTVFGTSRLRRDTSTSYGCSHPTGPRRVNSGFSPHRVARGSRFRRKMLACSAAAANWWSRSSPLVVLQILGPLAGKCFGDPLIRPGPPRHPQDACFGNVSNSLATRLASQLKARRNLSAGRPYDGHGQKNAELRCGR